jgi:EAL domain-containing protein (putative c-di-GMP-specific phosphodiesterase class I)
MRLVYQPLVDLTTRQVKGFEALLRWRHPRRGEVGPSEFIPLAEESGVIAELSRWVIREATRQAAAWSRAVDSPISISVNLSARQFDDDGLVEDVSRALRDAGLPAEDLTLEITESILLRDIDVVTQRMQAFKNLGVRLAIDDFGTGYSSLSYLRRLPVDILKIDQSFVAGVGSGSAERALVRSIVSLSQILGLETVAEGIEDETQLDALRSYGAEWGQGFLFARPLEVEDVLATLNDGATVPKRPVRSAATPKRRRSRSCTGTAPSAALAEST